MKKYLFILKTEIRTNLSYLSNIAVSFIGYAIHIYIFLNIWQYTYSDSSELINGYSMTQMVWYVIITEILWSALSGRRICRDICNDVKSGNIAYNLNKPYSYIGYILAVNLGKVFVKGIAFIVFGMTLGFIFLGSFPSLTILGVLAILLASILATMINIFIIAAIGLISFYIEDANPLFWLYSKLILVLGVMFPIEYFPSLVQTFLNYSPVYAVCYGPAKLFVDFSWNSCFEILMVQLIYLIISYLLCSLIYRRGVKKLNVNGG